MYRWHSQPRHSRECIRKGGLAIRASSLENYSTRCLISHRPGFLTEEPLFYRCPECGSLMVASSLRQEPGSPAREPSILCCGKTLSPLPVTTEPELADAHPMGFVIFGGYERNSVRIQVEGGFHPMEKDHRIEWIYLRTFQGGQLKLLPPGSRSFANFSFADHDAFVYCDRDICKMGREHCQFLCKRGMVAYAFCSRHGLFRMELDGR